MYLLLFVTTVVWGSTFVIIKDTMRIVDPFLLVAVRNLLAARHDVVLNLVANRHNVDHLEEWVDAVPRLFGPPTPRIHFSITMCPDHRPDAPPVLVAYSELAPKLQAAEL
mgnify:CR=1 FL=1